jgi:hypothetical protein
VHAILGLIIKVQLIRLPDTDEVLLNLEGLRILKKLQEENSLEATKLMILIQSQAITVSAASHIAICSVIRTIMLLEQYDEARKPG